MGIDYSFEIAADSVDPKLVPKKTLSSGDQIPIIGLGTFGSDHVTADQIAQSVLGAAEIGYRHFDCAMVYGNEKEIGFSLKTIQDAGILRKDLWVTSKLWNDKHDPKDVIETCEQSLKDLQLDYLDVYLVHWPFPNHHPPGCDGTTRNPNSKPYIHEDYMKTWEKMEELKDMGLVKNIGTSNMTIPKMKLVLRDCQIKPVINQMELHPHFQQPEFFDYLIQHNVQPVGYSPLGSPNRPERDTTPEDTNPLEDPIIKRIASDHNAHPVTICLKWAAQRGQIPIPFSTKRKNYLNNLKAVVEDPLTTSEMQEIATCDKDCRLIKGVVFLWKDDQPWEDLWDVDGTIKS